MLAVDVARCSHPIRPIKGGLILFVFYHPDIGPPGIGIRDRYKKMMAMQNCFAKISLTLATPKHCYDPPKQGIWVPWIPLALNLKGAGDNKKGSWLHLFLSL